VFTRFGEQPDQWVVDRVPDLGDQQDHAGQRRRQARHVSEEVEEEEAHDRRGHRQPDVARAKRQLGAQGDFLARQCIA
jgi:hypothetical protein